jgi:hypothetical protein
LSCVELITSSDQLTDDKNSTHKSAIKMLFNFSYISSIHSCTQGDKPCCRLEMTVGSPYAISPRTKL